MFWSPMDTAPKDGTEVIVYDAGAVFVAHWRDSDEWNVDGWYDHGGCFLSPSPTHWMPLPDPPTWKVGS